MYDVWYTATYLFTYICIRTVCNTFTPLTRERFCSIIVIYHTHRSPGVLQILIPCVLQFPSGICICSYATTSTGML